MSLIHHSAILNYNGKEVTVLFVKRRDLDNRLFYFVKLIRATDRRWFKMHYNGSNWYISDHWVEKWLFDLEKELDSIIQNISHMKAW